MYNLDKVIYDKLTSLGYNDVVNGYPTHFEDKQFPIIGFTLDILYDEVENINGRPMMYRNNYTIDVFGDYNVDLNEISSALEEEGLRLDGYRQLPTEQDNIIHYVLHFTALVQENK